MRRLALVPLLAAIGAATPAAAQVSYGEGATVVSASLQRQELADQATQVADLSRDGRYVAFATEATNFFADDDPDPDYDGGSGAVATDRRGGVFRRDVDTGALELVADGDLVREDDGTLLRRGARDPSISADGRYVVFHTAQRLVPEDVDGTSPHTDVYVRDMTVPICRPLPGCARNPYTLVSAADGSGVPLTYADPATPVATGVAGSEVYPGTAISSDGRRVAFRTRAASDAPAGGGVPATDAGQLLVRDLDARTTRLVTRRKTGDPLAGGPAGGASGAVVLSGDGTTVAWIGQNSDRQVRVQPGESGDDRYGFYLWQRVGEPTRRITGMVDTDDPACGPGQAVDPSDRVSQSACYGPLQQDEQAVSTLFTPPALSEDGYEVAFVTASAARGSGQVEGSATDLFTTSMRPGATRKGATIEWTREGFRDPASSGSIAAVAMSADGRYLAITTSRNRFLLPALRVLGALRTAPNGQDLLLVDRQAGTVQRTLLGLGGADPNGEPGPLLSMTDDGARIAFTSAARNLFIGDANGRDDAFVVGRQPPPVFEPPLPPLPDPPATEAVGELVPSPPSLSVLVRKGKRTGEMLLQVRPPAAGALSAQVTGRLPGKDGKRKAGAKIQLLSTAKGRAKKAERITLTLKLSRQRVALLKKVRTLATSAEVTWAPTDRTRTALRRRVTVRFAVVRPAQPKAKKKTRTTKPARARSRG